MRTILGITFGLLVVVFATPSLAQFPEHLWSERFGGTGIDEATAVAVDAVGNVFVTGIFNGTANFGGGNLVGSYYDIFLAKYDASGVHQWSQHFGGAGLDFSLGITVDGSGNVFLTGDFNGTVDFGGGNLVSAGGDDVFIAKYDANGLHQWSHRFGGTGNDVGRKVAVDASGNVFLTGAFEGTVNFGGGNLVSAGYQDIFLAKYDANGVHQWSQRFGGTLSDFGKGIAVDGSGNVVVAGEFGNTVDFGGGNLVSAGDYDIFLAKYNSNGVHQWSQRFGSTGADIGWGLAVDGSGNVFVTGSFNGTVDFGGGNLVSAGDHDIFLAKFNPSGAHQWSHRFGDTLTDFGLGIAVNASGNAFLTGEFQGTVTFGKGYLVSAGDRDIFLAKFNSSGVHQWSQRFGDTSGDEGEAVAVDGLGHAVVVGSFSGTVNFGGGNLVCSGEADVFVAKYGDPVSIIKMVDGPHDNGSHVEIIFKASAHDNPGINPRVLQYQAFRRNISPAGPPFVLAGGIPATMAESYVMDATTDGDSTCASGQHWSFFYVRATTDTRGVFYDSDIDSGYSVDNLPPGVPTNFTYAAGHLSWDASNAADFDYFSVYGNSTNSFGSATFVNNTVTPGMNVPPPVYAYYFVTATDHACNESGAASTGSLTGVGGTPVSYALSISAYPNPFNPETTIRYTLPTKGRITIDVFDARGAHVAKLVDAVTPAGAYTVTWTGHDDRGNAEGTGVYFARLTSPAGTRSYKLTLLK